MKAQNPARTLRFPPKLYGRELALDALGDMFEAACNGHARVVLVPGSSGIGKTCLIREIRAGVRARNGLFLEGKFNQYQQTIPYYAFREALGALFEDIMAEPDALIDQWRQRIQEAVGNLGQLLIDLLPEFETLLGKQAPVPEISPLEAPHRFAGLLREFLKVFCRPEHPVVMFLDDWQWADPASMDLLGRLHVGDELRYVLFVASYRDEEVHETHPLRHMIAELSRHAVPTDVLPIYNLTEVEVLALLTDTLAPAAEHSEQLARLLYKRTHGNPFFTRTLIKALAARRWLWFDDAACCWRWDHDRVSEDKLPSDVVRLFSDRLTLLPADVQSLLARAACLGSLFDLSHLAYVAKCPVDECHTLLRPVLEDGLIQRVRAAGSTQLYRFQHDRVQQAAYDLIPRPKRPEVRLGIGRLLQQCLSEDELADRLYLVVDHINSGLALVEDNAEKTQLVALNVRAARKARTATAYHAALQFHRTAALLCEDAAFVERLWSEHRHLARQFWLDRAETEFLEGDRCVAESCIRHAVARAEDAVEQAEALNALILQFTLLARYEEAVDAGREALAALGIGLPTGDYEKVRDQQIAEIRRRLRGRKVEDLARLPVMSDRTVRTAVKLLITMGPPCYRSHQRLWSVLVAKALNLTIEFGNVPQIGYIHTAFGGLIGWVENDYALARQFGDLATKLMNESFASTSDMSVFHLMIGSSVRHWCEPLTVSSADYTRAYEAGLVSGNLQYAAYAFGHNMYCRLYQGAPLRDVIAESEQSLAFSRTRLNKWAIDLLEGGLALMRALAETPKVPDDFEEWEQRYLERVADNDNIQVKCIYQVNRAMVLLVMGEYRQALRHCDEADPLIFTVGTQGLLPWPEHTFVRAMTLARLLPDADAAQRDAWRVDLARMKEQVQLWADACPQNFAHKCMLLEGECALLDGRHGDALHHFVEAAAQAAEAGFLQWEGVANERAAVFLEANGQPRLAQTCWEEAYRCFEQWGAAAKLHVLESDYRAQLPSGRPAHTSDKTVIAEADRLFADDLVDRHVRQLHAKAAGSRLLRLRDENRRKSAELADAIERLRHEVAQRKQAEDAMRRYSTELARSNSELERFAYVASHDLQAPLRRVSSFLQLLHEDYKGRFDEKADAYIQHAVDGALHMKSLVDGLLALARVGTGGGAFTKVSLEDCLEQTTLNLSETIHRCGAVITHDPLPDVEADDLQMVQLLQNLIGNAIKFCKIDRPRIRIAVTDEDAEWRISVRDNGVGFPMKKASQIFNVFSRLCGRTEFPGSGIGLSICKKIVERHGGRIWAESEPGAGSTFHFTLFKNADSGEVPLVPSIDPQVAALNGSLA